MAALLPILRRSAHLGTAVPDGELLARFASTRDEDAFAEIVHRHGPVVYRICCRLLGHEAAEDAFQAVFLVLATRLQAASAADSVGGWLVGVAGRVARQMRRAAQRRARHETTAAGSRTIECSDNTADLSDQSRLLDEELARLPTRLRDPIVLCLLQGHTQEEAAALLGRNARTLRRRLERAKHVLRARLARRGVVPVVAAALVAGVGPVSATVPPALVGRTVAVVFDFLTGGAGSAGSTPIILAKGVATNMLTQKLMHLMTAITAGLIGLGVVLAGNGPPDAAKPATTPAAEPPPAQPVPPALQTPLVPPMVAAPSQEIDWEKDEAQVQAVLKVAPRNAVRGQRTVVVDAMCVEVPGGFCQRSGLTAEEEVGIAWVLSPRERRMFQAILRGEPAKDILSRPRIVVTEGKTGFAQVGQDFPAVVGTASDPKDQKIVYTHLGITLRVTPHIGVDGRIIMRVKSTNAALSGISVEVPVDGAGTNTPAEYLQALAQHGVNVQDIETTVIVPDGGTALIQGVVARESVVEVRGAGKPRREVTRAKYESLWIITAHIVRDEKKPAEAPRPAPVMPPVRP
jgi:RNA polymerase sigma factor (sigma-70 family)